jgi:hypothetical protein
MTLRKRVSPWQVQMPSRPIVNLLKRQLYLTSPSRLTQNIVMRECFSALLVVASIVGTHAANLSVDHGNIVLNGKTLTHGGHDSDPVMSPDANRIVFNRSGPVSPTMKLCDDDGRLLELWSIGIDGRAGTGNLHRTISGVSA